MRVDMTMYDEGQAVRVATPSRSSTRLGLPPATSMQSSNSSSTPTLPLPAVTVSELFDFFATRASLNLFFKFFRFRHVLHVIVKLVGATDSDDDNE